jgi:hypothetical protein
MFVKLLHEQANSSPLPGPSVRYLYFPSLLPIATHWVIWWVVWEYYIIIPNVNLPMALNNSSLEVLP